MEILICPMCHGALTLEVVREEGDTVITGTIRCQKCGEAFAIEDGLPNMMPPDMRAP